MSAWRIGLIEVGTFILVSGGAVIAVLAAGRDGYQPRHDTRPTAPDFRTTPGWDWGLDDPTSHVTMRMTPADDRGMPGMQPVWRQPVATPRVRAIAAVPASVARPGDDYTDLIPAALERGRP